MSSELRELILTGALAAGAQLPSVADLSLTFGVSRETVRDALDELASQDVIAQADPPRVVVVAPNDASAFIETTVGMLRHAGVLRDDELYEVQELLLVASVEMASTHRSEEQLAALQEVTQRESQRRGVRDEYSAHLAFHRLLIESASNPLLTVMAEPLLRVIERRLSETDVPLEFWANVHEGHMAILAAVMAQDVDQATQAMRHHLVATRVLLRPDET